MELLAENLAIVKLAMMLCNAKDEELKREILCADGSVCFYESEECGFGIQIWNENIERESKMILKSVGITQQLQEKVTGVILTIGRKIFTWAKYHEQILGFSCEYVIKFFNIHSFTTRQGTINNVKVSEELMKDRNLSIKQKYVLACLHYRRDLITSLYREMNDDDRKELCNHVKYPGFVKYLTSSLMRKGGTLNLDDTVEYALEHAIESGSIQAVKVVLELAVSQGEYNDMILSIAKKAFKNITKSEKELSWDIEFSPFARFWTPIDYYLDIICFLLPKMGQDQIEDLISDADGNVMYINERNGEEGYSSLLKCFLNWPYQDYFMKTVSRMWKCLPKATYCDLLRTICKKIDPEVSDLNYGEEKNYDYRGLLRELWCISPEDFKRYVFSFSSTEYSEKFGLGTVFIADLLSILLNLEHFTYEDGELVRWIIASATDQEKEDIFFTNGNSTVWDGFIELERWEVFSRIMLYCFINKQEADKFKKRFIYTDSVNIVCLRFLKDKNYTAINSFIELICLPKEEIKELKKALGFSDEAKLFYIRLAEGDRWNETGAIFNWCCLSEEEINKVKSEAICSVVGRDVCRKICYSKGGEKAKQFCKRLLSSEDEIINFRKEVFSSDDVENDCINLLHNYGEAFVNDYINFCILPEKDLTILKNSVIYSDVGKRRCRSLCLTEGVETAKKFCEVFLTTEEEMEDFQKTLIFTEDFSKDDCAYLLEQFSIEAVGDLLKFCLISEVKLEELKECVAWDLSTEIFESLLTHHRISNRPKTYNGHTCLGINWVDVEQLLTWCFPSKEEITDFKKNLLLPVSGACIHYDLIKYNEWAEAETFFAWLELTVEEIKQLKKDTLNKYSLELRDHVHSTESASEYGGEEGVIEIFLMWFLNDKEVVDLELIDKLKYLFRLGDDFIQFDTMLEQHLISLNNEGVTMKRKNTEYHSPTKKLCISKNIK